MIGLKVRRVAQFAGTARYRVTFTRTDVPVEFTIPHVYQPDTRGRALMAKGLAGALLEWARLNAPEGK